MSQLGDEFGGTGNITFTFVLGGQGRSWNQEIRFEGEFVDRKAGCAAAGILSLRLGGLARGV